MSDPFEMMFWSIVVIALAYVVGKFIDFWDFND